MAEVQEQIELEVPVAVAYEQWSRFEDFPEFMDGVKDVEKLDERTMRWKLQIAGQRREFDAEVLQDTPNERIEWESVEEHPHHGTALFEALDDARSRITLRIEYEPQGALEKLADAGGIAQQKAKADLVRFKALVEAA